MKKIIIAIALLNFYFHSSATVTCTTLNSIANQNTIYKIDIDGDGVKDFWVHVYFTASGNLSTHYIVGKNGSEVEVDAPNGYDINRLEENNSIGNNYWNDTAYFVQDGLGNFSGANMNGYAGLRFYKNGNYYYCYVYVMLTIYQGPSFVAQTNVSYTGFNDIANDPLQAGQCLTTSIKPLHLSSTNIYPNPTTNQLNITTTLQGNDEVQYQIINTLGATAMANKATAKDFSIDVSTLPTGIYFIHLQSGNAKTVKRFVKE